MSQRSAIILVVDRLHAGMLGPYGNTWIDTRSFNQLAADCFLFDQAITDSPDLDSLYRSFWTGEHALARGPSKQPTSETIALPEQLRRAGVHTVLLRDEPLLAQNPLAAGFDEVIAVELPADAKTAESIDETHLARFFAAASAWLARESIQQRVARQQPFLLWLHTRGFGAPWDAPLEYRARYADEEDPDTPDFAEPPNRLLPEGFDPDELLGMMHAYAGQVALLDACLGGMCEQLEELRFAENVLFGLLSPRGFPLGEHRRVGPYDDALHGELVHIPWLLRLPDGTGSSARSQHLVQPPDLHATLTDWLLDQKQIVPARVLDGQSVLPIVRGESNVWRDRACIVGRSLERVIRTPAWHLRLPALDIEKGWKASTSAQEVVEADMSHDTTGATPSELYSKPDDRYEVNEVSDRCPDIVAGLRQALEQTEAASASTGDPLLEPLSEELVRGPD